MRLFLSSENLGNHPEVFKKLVGDKKLAFVENAKDDWSVGDRKAKLREHLEQFTGEGFDVQELDLRKYFGKTEELKKWLQNFNGIFVAGGNTFILRRAMAASGFDEIITQMLADDLIAYGGSSAGSCVMAKDLHGIDIGDFPEDVPKEYPNKEVPWEGVGVVNFMVVPHYGSDWWGKEAKLATKYMQKHNLPYKTLNDGQVYIIDGERRELLK